MSFIYSLTGIVILILLSIFLILFARASWAGALSLPSMALLTGVLYFYVLPTLFILSGEDSFYGLGMEGLPSAQIAMALYMLGAVIAFWAGRRQILIHPLQAQPVERLPNRTAYWAVLAALGLVIAAKFYLGEIGFGGAQVSNADAEVSGLGFLNLAYSSLIAMTIYTLIQTRFSPVAILLFVAVLGVFLLDGFRFRMVVLCSAAALSWCVYRRFRPGLMLVGGAVVIGLVIFNIIGMTRTYGRGIDLAGVEGRGFQELLQSVGGEIGPVFVLCHLTGRETDFIFLEPWYVAIARLVPSAIWPGKPYPDYLLAYHQGFPDPRIMMSGLAGTQHAEFYMQLGWIGLPILAFGFFMLAIWTLKRLSTLSPAARLAGASIMPALVGFYAQQRGYTFQIMCEYIFTLAPLFLIHIGGQRFVRPVGTPPQNQRPAPA